MKSHKHTTSKTTNPSSINRSDTILSIKRLPASCCVICEKSLKEIGGYRIVSQQIRGSCVTGSPNHWDDDNQEQHQSFKLSDDLDVYLHVWGEETKWTKAAIERAKTIFLNGECPWFCHICAERKCRECGSAINYPAGSDILYENGCSSHVAILGFNSGCTNTSCENYREWTLGNK